MNTVYAAFLYAAFTRYAKLAMNIHTACVMKRHSRRSNYQRANALFYAVSYPPAPFTINVVVRARAASRGL